VCVCVMGEWSMMSVGGGCMVNARCMSQCGWCMMSVRSMSECERCIGEFEWCIDGCGVYGLV